MRGGGQDQSERSEQREGRIVGQRAKQREHRAPCPAEAHHASLRERGDPQRRRPARHLRREAFEPREIARVGAVLDGAGEHQEERTGERARRGEDHRAGEPLRRKRARTEEHEANLRGRGRGGEPSQISLTERAERTVHRGHRAEGDHDARRPAHALWKHRAADAQQRADTDRRQRR